MSEEKLVREYRVRGAPAYGDPFAPWPQTIENVLRFQRENGGEIITRVCSDWEPVAPDTLRQVGP